MGLFSERYGYVKPSEAIIVECLSQEVQNAIFNCLKILYRQIYVDLIKIQKDVCAHFLNKKTDRFNNNPYYDVIIPYLENPDIEWYKKLDLIELESLNISLIILNKIVNFFYYYYIQQYFIYK